LTVLYRFESEPGGFYGEATLVQGSDGNFYGTTGGGGTNSLECGTVFKLTVPLSPPPNQISQLGYASSNCTFTIPSVAGETYQLETSSSVSGRWSNVGSPVKSIGGPLTVTDPTCGSTSNGFYRFDITP
jgi:uncharacterized repeat protein (TIGR03803 family)